MSRFSFLFFALIALTAGILGMVREGRGLSYYSEDILCDYKVPLSCGVYKTLYCKGRYTDLPSLELLERCGCVISDIDVGYGKKAFLDKDCRISSFWMSGYERLMLGLRIDVNSASLSDLISIDGIGESVAERIIEYRIKNGRFGRTDDLGKIRGIGKKNLLRIEKYLCVDC